jgi:proline dehydrogenase
VLRGALLWSASNPWLANHVPRWRFVRRAVRRFMPGEDFETALKVAVQFKPQRIGAVFTRLGENLRSQEQAKAEVEHYEMVLEKIAAAGVEPEISVKPTHLGLDINPDVAFKNLVRLAAAAAKVRGFLWVDMEGSAYTEATLDLYARLRADHPKVGVCLQAYLYRTADDLGRLLPLKPSIRLTKGAYAEPPERAFPAKRDVDANFLALSTVMLPEVKKGHLRLVLGTHDVVMIGRITQYAEALGLERTQLEVHMLYGIQSGQLARLAGEGYRTKALVSYGAAWYAWYVRRLAERPANMLFVARQIFG